MTDTVPGYTAPAPATPRKSPAICVFCGSSYGKDPAYRAAAEKLGTALTASGFNLVFGGGRLGLMGVVASAVAKGGGKILGIIPHFLRHIEPPLDVVSEIVVTEGLNERKARMLAASDGFAILPGGLGTLDELAEVFTGAQLSVHAKPIVLVNVKNYFAPFLALVDHMIAEGFAAPGVKSHFHVAATPEEAVAIFAGAIGPRPSGTEAGKQYSKEK
jgi:hypothetical protein